MPRRSPSVPRYCLHKPSGRAYCRIRGKVIYCGKYDTPESQQQYARIVNEAAANPEAPPSAVPTSISVVEVIDRYWDFAQRYYIKHGEPTTMVECIRQALRPLRQLYAETPAIEFGPKRLKAVRQAMIDSGRLNRTTINKRVDVIRRMFRWAVAEELVPPSIDQGLQAVPGLRRGRADAVREPEDVLPVPDATVDATLSHLPQVVGDMVRFQRFTGARPTEVCQLRPCDVDRSGDVWQYRPRSHKTEHHGRERIIYIGPKAQQVLLSYLLRDATAFCFSPIESEAQRREMQHAARKTPLSHGCRPGSNRRAQPKRKPKDHYTKDGYGRAVRRACELAFGMPEGLRKIPKGLPADERERLESAAAEWRKVNCWHPNQLRHSKGTEVRGRFGLEAAQVTLGHSKADVTQVYAERDVALGLKVAKLMG
jgi:integrase